MPTCPRTTRQTLAHALHEQVTNHPKLADTGRGQKCVRHGGRVRSQIPNECTQQVAHAATHQNPAEWARHVARPQDKPTQRNQPQPEEQRTRAPGAVSEVVQHEGGRRVSDRAGDDHLQGRRGEHGGGQKGHRVHEPECRDRAGRERVHLTKQLKEEQGGKGLGNDGHEVGGHTKPRKRFVPGELGCSRDRVARHVQPVPDHHIAEQTKDGKPEIGKTGQPRRLLQRRCVRPVSAIGANTSTDSSGSGSFSALSGSTSLVLMSASLPTLESRMCSRLGRSSLAQLSRRYSDGHRAISQLLARHTRHHDMVHPAGCLTVDSDRGRKTSGLSTRVFCRFG